MTFAKEHSLGSKLIYLLYPQRKLQISQIATTLKSSKLVNSALKGVRNNTMQKGAEKIEQWLSPFMCRRLGQFETEMGIGGVENACLHGLLKKEQGGRKGEKGEGVREHEKEGSNWS